MVFWLGLIILIIGIIIGIVIAAFLRMASQGEQEQEAYELAHAHNGHTWCPVCQAMFKGATCPGCGPGQAAG